MIWETIILAVKAIRRNVLRSSLTILGIVIGVASVIIMVTLGNGATAQVTKEISSLGSNMLQLRPGQGFRGPGGRRSSAPSFDLDDVAAIRRDISGLEGVAGTNQQGSQIIYGNKNWASSALGTTNDYFTVRDWELKSGRLFNGAELRSGRTVCIIGTTIVKELFEEQDPLGATIRLNKLACQVIAVLESKGQTSFGRDQDDIVVIPIRTLQRRMVGNDEVKTIFVSAIDQVSTATVQADIERLMRERRRITGNEDDNFHVRDMQEIVSALTSTTKVLTILLSAVAAVSLLVGGIGIMNIMLVSVTERTREIGTRLAIGALERDVLLQFLIEAVVLSAFGGIVGILLGLIVSILATHMLHMPLVINTSLIVMAFGFSAAVGIVFGYFPARQAARLDPIEALRHE